MNDIAIYFEKYNLGNERYVFKPITMIRGYYNKESDEFQTEYGVICHPLEMCDYDIEDYFDCVTNMDELKKIFGENNTEAVLLDEYFALSTSYCYLVYFASSSEKFEVKKISYEDLEYDTEISALLKQDGDESKFIFNLNGIKDLRDSENITEVRNKLDNLINIHSQVIGTIDKNRDTQLNKKQSDVKNFSVLENSKKLISLKELRKEILRSIVGQDRAVNDITREIMINQTSNNPRNKSHILVTGPTGTGKTEIARSISKILDLPFFEADATAYTKEGYVGKSVYTMLESLIDSADGDIERAQNGILIIDEIDKKVSDEDNVSGTAVLQSLYKIMDRGIVELDLGRPGYREALLFDTSNLTIILMGAFEDLYQNKINEGKKSLGFVTDSKIEVPKKEIILTKNDLYKGGVPAELLGRIGDITSTSFFEVKDLVRLLTRSDISALRLQKQYFKEAFNTELKYTNGYVTKVAEKAIETKTNARELKPIVRETLKYATDEFLMGRRGKVLKLTKATALDPKKYYVE